MTDSDHSGTQAMPRKSDKVQDRSFTMRVDEEWEHKIDELRILERPVLTRAGYLKKVTDELYAERVGRKRRGAMR